MTNQKKEYELIKFEDGEFSLDVNVSPNEDTVWLTQNEMAMLFNFTRNNINLHIKNIYQELEQDQFSTCKDFLQVQTEGNRMVKRNIKYYNLDMILSVGYRVKSTRGNKFRQWANSILKRYLLSGYSINERRCLDCQENIISLNNKVNILMESNNDLNNRLLSLESDDNILSTMLFYENHVFEAYSYIKKLLLSAQREITIVDGYVDISVLDMLNEINLQITIYTFESAHLSNQDILKFQMNHNLIVNRTNIIHDRFLIIDDDIYSIGSSIKDVGKKRFVMTKIESIGKEALLKELL